MSIHEVLPQQGVAVWRPAHEPPNEGSEVLGWNAYGYQLAHYVKAPGAEAPAFYWTDKPGPNALELTLVMWMPLSAPVVSGPQ